MSTAGHLAPNRQNAKELDSMKESISDIINQLQDIDPARLSFSPFLDLDTQISLAPVSDSPESSVEELRSSSHSVSGSQRSLEPPPAAEEPRRSAPRHRQPNVSLPGGPGPDRTAEGDLDPTLSRPLAAAHGLDGAVENRVASPTPAARGDIPNGTDTPRWSPGSTDLEGTVNEGRPLIGPRPESVELAVWTEGPEGETCGEEVSDGAPRPRCCCRCRCCQSGRAPAFFSVLASLLCAAGILYALYFHVPIRPPDCSDGGCRVLLALCCCAAAALPILLAMLTGAACQFCSGSLSLLEPFPRRQTLQQLFVTASSQQLLLYVLNLTVMAALLPQDQLKLVPIVAAMFIFGRLVYWLSLNTCSSWRGFGSGLTLFPLLAMVALNLFLMYTLSLKEPLFGSQDVLYNQVNPSSWSRETSQSPSGKPDILDAQ
ncbi:uncharacterized protein ACNS7B_004473 isoform 2-T3 [Menidia menidia]